MRTNTSLSLLLLSKLKRYRKVSTWTRAWWQSITYHNWELVKVFLIWKDIVAPNCCSLSQRYCGEEHFVRQDGLAKRIRGGGWNPLSRCYSSFFKILFKLLFQLFVNPKVKSRYNCYMLLGYDILIDANLQPHLIGESWRGKNWW